MLEVIMLCYVRSYNDFSEANDLNFSQDYLLKYI